MATANQLLQHTFDGEGYPTFEVWPGFDWPTGNPNSYGKPVVTGDGFGIGNRYQRLLWRARSQNSPGIPNYKADISVLYENAGGAGRGVGLICRFVDWDNLIIARLMSVPAGSPTLKLYTRVGGIETQRGSTYSGSSISATQLNAGVTFRVKVEDLDTGETRIRVYTDPNGDSGNGDVRIDWTGEIPELRGVHTVGVELSKDVGGEDIKVDTLTVYDLADEPSPSGSSPDGTSGWTVDLDGMNYPIDDRTGGLQGMDPPIELVEVTQTYARSSGISAKFRVLGDWARGALRIGQRVRVLHNGDVRFDGLFHRAGKSAGPAESQEWEARAGVFGGLDVLVESDACEPNILWNVSPDDTENYNPDFADKSIGFIIEYLLRRYKQQLQVQGAAPTDGTDPFVTEELQALDAVVPGLTSTGSVLTAVQTALQQMPNYALYWDCQTRVWRFRNTEDLDAETITLTSNPEWVTFSLEAVSDQAYTAVVFAGTRKEPDPDALTLTMADKAWTPAQEAAHNVTKNTKTHVYLKIVSSGVGAITDPGVCYVDVLAGVLDEDDFKGAIATFSDDGHPRWVSHHSSTRIWFGSPLWDGGTSPAPGSTVTLDLLHPQARRALAAGGVGRAFYLPIAVVDGETECNLNTFVHNLRNGGFCGTAKVSGQAADGTTHTYYTAYQVEMPSQIGMDAGECRPLATLAHPPKKPPGFLPDALIMRFEDGSAQNLFGGADLGGAGVSQSGSSDVAGCTPDLSGIQIDLQIPKTKTCAPRLRVPATGYRGTAYSDDEANWDGGGEPALTDQGVRRELLIQLSEYTDPATQDEGLTKAADAILARVGQRGIRWSIRLATPWRAFSDGTSYYANGSATTRWAGLTKKVRLASSKRTTGFETADDLCVHSVTWNIPAGTTTLVCGNAAGAIGGDFGVIAQATAARQAAQQQAAKIKRLEEIQQKQLGKPVDIVMAPSPGATKACNVQTFDSNTKSVRNVQEKMEVEQTASNRLSLGEKLSDSLNSGSESFHPGAMPEVPGFTDRQITARSGPSGEVLVDHRTLFAGPSDAVNGNRSTYRGVLGVDTADAGKPADLIKKVGNIGFYLKPNAEETDGGKVGLLYSVLDAHGQPTEFFDYTSPLDLPTGKIPLTSANHGSWIDQLKVRDDAFAKQLGAMLDETGAVLQPGEQGAPASLSSLLRTPGVLGDFQIVKHLDPKWGFILKGPFRPGAVGDDPSQETFWASKAPQNLLVQVTATGDPATNGGSVWEMDTSGPGGTTPYIVYGKVIDKDFTGDALSRDTRYAAVDSMPVSNPFGAESEESLRLNGVSPGDPSGAAITFDVPKGCISWHFEATVAEDESGTAVGDGETYGDLRIDWASRSSPWTTPTTGAAQAGMTGDGSNTGTGQFKQPGGAVPPGLRTPSDIAASVVYTPGGGTASINASLGVRGLHVTLAMVQGGYALFIEEFVGIHEHFRDPMHWNHDVAMTVETFNLEIEHHHSEGIGCYEDFALEILNP